jgi:predicted methyltransferase
MPYNYGMHKENVMEKYEQKYPSAYYLYRFKDGEKFHYVTHNGIRTRHASMDKALGVCERINKEAGLPDINVYKSNKFTLRRTDV